MANIAGGVKITGFISPTDTADTYAVIDPVYGVDSLRNVDDIAARDAITSERRRAGMIVGVKNGAFNDYYVLNSGNTTWSQIQMVTGLTWDLGSYDLTLNTFGGGITKNLSSLASDVTVTGGTYNSLNGIVTFSSSTTNTRTGLYYAGSWSALSAYSASTVVTYSGNSLDYYSIANVSANPTPPSGDTANWRPISSRGVFIVTGFTAGYTNIYTTAATYNQTTASIALDFTDPSKNLSITGVTTLYGKDDSIKSNRRVDLNQKTLNFSSSTAPNSLTISTGGTVGIGVLSTGTTKLHVSAATDPIRIEGIGGSSDSDVLTIDISGVVHTISVASLTSTVASSISTLYTSNGALNGNRVVDLNQKTLNFSSSTIPNALTISTGGTVGIGVLSGTNALHVSATTNPVKIEGLTAVSATTKLVATNANNELVNFSGTNQSIPFFSTAGVITHSPTFTYSNSTTRTLQIDDDELSRGSQITLGGGRGNIITTSSVNSGLIFQAGTSNPFDQTKSITLKNGATNYVSFTTSGVIGGNSAHTATFTSTVSINNVSITTSNWGLSGIATRVLANNYTDSTTATTTDGETVASSFAIPTFTALTGKTYSALTNVYIAGAPIAGTNVTGLTSYALKVNAGTTYFGGNVTLSGISSADTATQVLTRESNGNVSFKNISDIGGGNFTADTFVTGFTLSSNTITLTQNRTDGYSAFTISLSAYTGSSSASGAYLPLSGGTVSGGTVFTSGLTANTLTLSGISSGTTAPQLLTRESNGSVSFKSITDITGGNVLGNIGATLYWYDENNTPPAVIPVATGTGSIAFGNGAKALASSMFVFGLSAGTSATNASGSTFIGDRSGFGATFADNSLFIGDQAGYQSSNANNSTFIGVGAGSNASSASNSTFIGTQSGLGGTSANNSIMIGSQAGYGATSANNSQFFGVSAGKGATGATYSFFAGSGAGWSASSVTSSTFIGKNAGSGATAASYSTFIGEDAGSGANNTSNSLFVGQDAGFSAPASSGSIFIAQEAGYQASGTTDSIFMGYQAGYQASGNSDSIFIGKQAGYRTFNKQDNIFIGNQAGYRINDNNSVAVGARAGYQSTGSSNSVFIGYYAGNLTTLSNNNLSSVVFIGPSAGSNASGATQSVFIGQSAGSFGRNAGNSTFIGAGAGNLATNASGSVIIGNNAGQIASGASSSVFIGAGAGDTAINASSSVMIGNSTGLSALSANQSIMIGYNAGYLATGASESILIGGQAGYATSNTLSIGSNNIIIGGNITLSAGSTNRINIGGIIFGTGVYNGALTTAATTTGAISIGVVVPNSSAILDLTSTSKGFLPPRMTATQASAVSSPAEGLMIYVTSTNGTFTSVGWWGYGGSPVQWRQIG